MSQKTPFVHRRSVEFVDTDMAGIVHFSNILRFMEEAEHAFLRSKGLSVFQQAGEITVTWPRRSVHCDFKSPARFEEIVDVAVHVEKLGGKSLTLGFDLSIGDRPVAVGRIVTVCCVVQDDGSLRSMEIPSEIAQKLTS
jgi:YbgC/YbaW family acyl-CoA thioester hydrolase